MGRLGLVAPAMVGFVATAAAGAAACGDNVVADGIGVRSGDRLRARYLASGDARQFLGFHDRERDEDCTFELGTGQSAAHCLPRSQYFEAFVDPTCTTPAMVRYDDDGACVELPRYVAVPSTLCGLVVGRLWSVGMSPLHPSTVYLPNAQGQCTGFAPRAGTTWYAGVELVPFDQFVRADIHTVAGPERLHQRYLYAADGARVPAGVIDTELELPCSLWDANRHVACHPDVIEGGWLWADDACTETLVVRDVNHPACAGDLAPYAAIWRPGGECGYVRHLVELGAQVNRTEAHTGMGGSCRLTDVSDEEIYEIGAEIPAERLAAAGKELVGNGRIRPYVLVGDGARRGDSGLRDVELDVDCYIGRTRDGKRRCIPSGGSVFTVFVDDRCQIEREVAVRWLFCGQSWPTTVTAVDSDPPTETCGEYTSTVFGVGDEITSGTYFERDSDGLCIRATWDRAETRQYELAAEIPATRFAAFEEITE